MLIKYFLILLTNSILICVAEDKCPEHNNDRKLDKINSKLEDVAVSHVNRQQMAEDATPDHAYYYDVSESEEEYDYDYTYDSLELEDNDDGERLKRAASNPSISSSKFITSGKQIEIKMYPWMVRIHIFQKDDIIFCGGSLIDSKFVLTAAHCFGTSVPNLNNIHVILAEYDTRTFPRDCFKYLNGTEQCFDNVKMFPERVIIHNWYDQDIVANDIALIKLKGIAPISEFIRPIPLPKYNIDYPSNTGLELIIAGWGKVYKTGEESPVTLETNVNLVPFHECRRTTRVPWRKVCAIGKIGQDACHGDSGGPLMACHQGHYFLAGIISGKSYYNKDAECGSRVPTTYTNVYRYLKWIRQYMRI